MKILLLIPSFYTLHKIIANGFQRLGFEVYHHDYHHDINKWHDGHVGNQNLLMNSGVIGFGLFTILLVTFIAKLFKLNVILSNRNHFKSVHLPIILFLLGLIIIHSSSAQVFGYLISMSAGFILCLLFSFTNFVYWESLKEEKRFKTEYKGKNKDE